MTKLLEFLERVRVSRGEKSAAHTRMMLAPFERVRGERVIDSAMLDDYRAWLGAQPLKAASRNRMLAALRSYLHFMRRQKLVELTRDDIADALPKFREPDREPVAYTQQEIAALVQAALNNKRPYAHEMRLFVLLGLLVGARPGELGKLAPCDFSERGVRILASKTGKLRYVPPSGSELLAFLCKWLPYYRGHDQRPLMRHEPGRKAWATLLADAGIARGSRKSLRSTCAAYCASGMRGDGASEYLISSRFGHSPAVARRYYLQPLPGLTGASLEKWLLGSNDFLLWALANECISHLLQWPPEHVIPASAFAAA